MKLTAKQIDRYRLDPAAFIETQLVDPVTNKPFVLLPAERAFIERAFQIDGEDRPPALSGKGLRDTAQRRQDRLRRDDDVDHGIVVRRPIRRRLLRRE